MATLADYIDDYARLRDLRPSSVGFYRRAIRQFENRSRHLVLGTITDDVVNNFLETLKREGKSASYRRGLRTAVVTIWKFAARREGLPGPVEISAVRRAPTVPRAWSVEDVARLRAAAERLPGFFLVSRIPRGPYFATLIDGAWYTGLSQIDLHRLRWPDLIRGKLVTTRSKTGARVVAQIPPVALAAIEVYMSTRTDDFAPIWPLWASREIFRRTFARIVAEAGLVGSFKTIRSSAGTAVEIARPGTGHIFLGNSRDVFLRNYFDPRHIPTDLPGPPTLEKN